MVRLTHEMMRSLPRQRDVVSFHSGVDLGGRAFSIKFALQNGAHDLLLLPPAVAFHVRDEIARAIKHHRYKDVRRRQGETKPEVTIIRDFLAKQPDFVAEDWDGKDAEGQSRVVIGCEVHSYQDALFLGFQLTADTYKVLRLPPAICFYLTKMVAEAEQSGKLVDLGRATPLTHSRQ